MDKLGPISDKLRRCRPTYDLFRKYYTEAVQSHNGKLYTLAYLFGLDAVRVLMEEYSQLDDGDEDAKLECSDAAKQVMAALEKIKRRQLSKSKQFVDVVADEGVARQLVGKWCLRQLKQVDSVFRSGAIDGSTVDALVDASVGLQVLMEMPEREEGEEEEGEEEEASEEAADEKTSQSAVEDLDDAGAALSQPMDFGRSLLPPAKLDDPDMSKEEILAKIKWCNYHIGRIIQCFKNGQDPNEDLAGLLAQPATAEAPISQEEIDKVIAEAMQMKEVELSDDSDGEYYYDSDEGEYVKKGALASKLPDAPRGVEGTGETVEDIKSVPVDDPVPVDPPSTVPIAPSAASIVAAKAQSRAASSQPMDLQSVENSLENEHLLDSAAKCCRFAISAIGYEDVSTAVDELRESLKLLEEYQKAQSGAQS